MTTRSERIAKLHTEVATLRTRINAEQKGSIGETIDEAVQLYMRENKGTSYSAALDIILRANPDLAKEYLESFASHAFMARDRA